MIWIILAIVELIAIIIINEDWIDGEEIFACVVLGFCLGAIAWLIMGGVIGVGVKKAKIVDTKQLYQLSNIGDNVTKYKDYYLLIDKKSQILYSVKNEDGKRELKKINSSNTTIEYTNEQPYIEVINKSFSNKAWWLIAMDWSSPEVKIYVPEDGIINDLSVDSSNYLDKK